MEMMDKEALEKRAVVKSLVKNLSENYVQKLMDISAQMGDGSISYEEGKKLSSKLRQQNPTLHAQAMEIVGERYGFAKEYDEKEKEEEKQRKKFGMKKPWKAGLMLVKKQEEETPQGEKENG